jgi:hypothetical protein
MFLITLALIILVLFVLYKVKFSARDAAWATLPRLRSKIMQLNYGFAELLELTHENSLEKLNEWQEQLGEVFLVVKHPFDCGTIFIADPVIAEAVSFHQPFRTLALPYLSMSKFLGTDSLFMTVEPNERLKQKLNIAFKALKPARLHQVT